MGSIYLIRHANTYDNQEMRFSGRTDCVISQDGYEQIPLLGKEMSKYPVDRVYSSPLSRAMITAKGFCENPQPLEGLIEMNFGILEALKLEEIKEKHPLEYQKFFEQGPAYHFPEGESVPEFYVRVNRVFKELTDAMGQDENIAIVAHSGTIRTILSHLMTKTNDAYWKFQIDNCSITKVTLKDDFPVFNFVNYTGHLQKRDEVSHD